MIVSHKHKFIYIKAGKVAGTSTELLLEKYCGPDDIVTPIKPKVQGHEARNYQEGNFKNHRPAKYILKNIGSDIFNEYHKVMNVRNPWDRVVSMYYMKNQHVSFEDYVKSGTKDVDPLYHYCAINKKPCLDSVIRFENLFDDTISFMKSHFPPSNFSEIQYPRAKTEHSHRPCFRSHYSEETMNIINDRYLNDIECFGYEFGE